MNLPVAIVVFFVGHWITSVFFQTFFLHRYGAHRMFTMSHRWERFFHLCTYVSQGSSYLNPRAYAILHRMHHAYSDTEQDPHSPVVLKTVTKMMWRTLIMYRGVLRGTLAVEPRFLGEYPEWPALDRVANRWSAAVGWGALYTLFYMHFATAWWQFLLVPAHYLMGPLHGSIVNWFGHRVGYRNFNQKDGSRNTLVFDFVTMGELFQNNHHTYGSRANFAVRPWEIDPSWPAIWLLDRLGAIRLRAPSRALPVPRELESKASQELSVLDALPQTISAIPETIGAVGTAPADA
jgi:stearoyl-CoA desaturase (delta-9 desaturase)